MTKSTSSEVTVMPYEKFLEMGPESLTESELLAIILRTGTKDMSALSLAEEILHRTGPLKKGLLGLYDMSIRQLMEIRGIGEVKAVKIKCITELSMRISRATAKQGLCVNHPATVADYFMEQLRHRTTECVVLVCMDTKGQIIQERLLSNGSVNMSLISPREIFLAALDCRAVTMILVHNHPSGDPTPSSSDRLLTDNIREMGDKLGIPLLDHIIIGDNRYISFKESSYL